MVTGNLLTCSDCVVQVQARTGVYPRVMYDTLFSYIAGWRQVAELAGGVKGILGNGNALMSEVILTLACASEGFLERGRSVSSLR